MAGTLRASSAPGPGGLVEVIADGDVVIGGTLTADGGAEPGGLVSVLGCSVLLCGFNADLCDGATGTLRTLGPNGTNRVTGRTDALIFGNMTTILAGRNEVVVRPPGSQNATVLGTVSPPAIVVEDGSLTSCPVCGNRVVEPPETCDDGNTEDGDGCSADCRLEGDVLAGDVNGDFVVNHEDLGFLATEIFDGDGALVANVSGGAFAGGARGRRQWRRTDRRRRFRGAGRGSRRTVTPQVAMMDHLASGRLTAAALPLSARPVMILESCRPLGRFRKGGGIFDVCRELGS